MLIAKITKIEFENQGILDDKRFLGLYANSSL